MIPTVQGEFGVVMEPELRFSDNGAAWLKVRGAAKDRVYNAEKKEWEDKGDPLYIDILISGKAAENLCESIAIGDSIVVNGKLNQREWEQDGVKRKDFQIRATDVGVSVRFGTAATHRAGGKAKTVPAAADQPVDAPF